MQQGSSVRRKLCMTDTLPSFELDPSCLMKYGSESLKNDLPVPVLVDEEECVSADREGVSDIGESEVEGVAGRYVLQTLNRTLMELYHTCEVDHNLDRCDYVLAILQEAIPSFEALRCKILHEVKFVHERIYHRENFAWHAVGQPSNSSHLVKNEGASEGKDSIQTSEEFETKFVDISVVKSISNNSRSSGQESNGFEVNLHVSDSNQKDNHDSSVQTWCDVVRRKDKRPFSASLQAVNSPSLRSLQEKLLSPDRHRMNPEDMQKKQEEKQEHAKKKREEFETLRQERLREADQQRQEKLRQIREKRETEKSSMEERLKRAHELYQSKLLERQQRAGKETAKVYEVKQEIAFIDQLTAENKILALQTRLELAEARRLQTLESAAKVSERTMREASARQRREAIEIAKIEKLQARQAQKFGSLPDTAVENSDLDLFRQLPGKEEARDRMSVSRDEAARQRREQLEFERQRKVEQAAQDKEHRAEEHQRRLLQERMKVLAAKEARLRHQASRLDRMTKAMQADAEAQRESLEQRLQSVVERKHRYMSRIVTKAQGAKNSFCTLVAAEPSSVSTESCKGGLPAKSAAAETTKSTASESPEHNLDKATKSQRKRARKFKQKLISMQDEWTEKDAIVDCNLKGQVASSKMSKLNKLLQDVVKGIPDPQGVGKVSSLSGGPKTRQLLRDQQGMLRTLLDIYRLAKESPVHSRIGLSQHERDFLCNSFRKSGCMLAVFRLLIVDETLCPRNLISAALRVLNDMCLDETNQLFVLSTGKLVFLFDLLDRILSEQPVELEGDSCLHLQLVLAIISRCLSLQLEVAMQPRDYSLGYLANSRILVKLESFVISVIADATVAEPKNMHKRGLIFSKGFKVIEFVLDLILAVTHCSEVRGHISTAIQDRIVLSDLILSFQDCRLVGLVPLLSTLILDVEVCSSASVVHEIENESLTWPCHEGVAYAVKALRALNNIAVMDLSFIQRVLGSVVICSEFSHVALRILERFCNSTLKSSELLHELILLLGFMALSGSPDIQSPFSGWRNGVKMLQQLCALPITYFTSPSLREVLLPTLVVATLNNHALLDAVRDRLSGEFLATYLDHQLQCLPNIGLSSMIRSHDGLSRDWGCLPPPSSLSRFHLCNRLPTARWGDASKWFRCCR